MAIITPINRSTPNDGLGANLYDAAGIINTNFNNLNNDKMEKSTYDAANVGGQIVNTSSTQTLTGKTYSNPILNGNISGTGVDDDSNLAANSATRLVTQRAVKAYIDRARGFNLNNDGLTDIGADLLTAITNNINPITGVSVVTMEPGRYLCNLELTTSAVATLRTAGCKKIIIRANTPGTVDLIQWSHLPCIRFDMSGQASAPVAISALSYGTMNYVTIAGITQANPAVVTTSQNHNYVTGDYVTLAGIGGMTQLTTISNSGRFRITVLSPTTFSLQRSDTFVNVDSTGFSAYTSGGTSSKYDPYSWLSRLSVANSGFSKNDVINISSQNRPEYSPTSRWVGEAARIKELDAAMIQIDGQLEFQNMYLTSPVVRKLSKDLTLELENLNFVPRGDSNRREADITAITRGTTTTVTTLGNHNFQVGERIKFDRTRIGTAASDIQGMTQIRGLTGTVTSIVSPTQFVVNINSSTFSNYTGGGSVFLQRVAAIICTAAVDVRVRFCKFSNPWHASVRLESCVDCFVDDCEFRDGWNQPTNDQITYGVQTYGACYNCWVQRCTFTGYRHAFTTDGIGASSYSNGNWQFYGQPVFCGVRESHSSESKGAPWDTHEEGANIQFVNCTAQNCHSSDEELQYTGSAFQIRCRRAVIKGCLVKNANYGIVWKPYEHGTDNWLKIIDTNVYYLDYQSDQGRGVYVTEGGTMTNTPRLEMENCSFDVCGISIQSDIPLIINGQNIKSERPMRLHVQFAPGSLANFVDMYWNSDSSNLTAAQTANRNTTGILIQGSGECHIHGLQHRLGRVTNSTTTATITGITQANPGVVTTSGSHTFVKGDYIQISGVTGMTQVNGLYQIEPLSLTTFRLLNVNTMQPVNTTSFTAYGSGGTATRVVEQVNSIFSLNETVRTITAITRANPAVITATGHGFATNDEVVIYNIATMTQMNGVRATITVIDANTFSLNGVDSSAFTTYSGSGGRVLRITTKRVSLTGYQEFDQFGRGITRVFPADRERAFTLVDMDQTTLVPKAALPPAGKLRRQAFVIDDVGGPVPAYDSGTAWRRITDGNTIS